MSSHQAIVIQYQLVIIIFFLGMIYGKLRR